MSSPIHQPEDLDAALIYAPPWARDQAVALSGRPPAPPAERPPRIRHIDKGQRGFSGDRAMLELQRQLALNPDAVPEPHLEGARNLWPIALRMCAVTGVAALAAWAIVSLPGTKRPGNGPVQAAAGPTPFAVNRVKLVHFRSATDVPPVVPAMSAEANAPPLPAEITPVPPPQSNSAPSVSGTPVLDNDEIAVLVKRGQDFLQNGDLASARLILRRAAEAGSANAALALGATFDPLVIQRLGVIGIEPDIARARQWYQRAAELGSATASQQLTKLERAH